ncbi:DUF221 domain-containing protein [Phyllosticta citriasiana]|uniref:DUF221 domain-containing protein n=1 Tax=Phyllosticta citriasiana TaxID=595635 RepID=UPI0030FD3A48
MSLAWTTLKDPWDGGVGIAWKRSDINISDAWNQAAGTAQADEGMSLPQLLASCAVGLAALGLCLFIFIVLRKNIVRIYEPATYLVPERQQMSPPGDGPVAWLKNVFLTRRSEFIEKAGMDAYCFTRFFYMQLQLFVPLAIVVMPIVICLNSVGVRDRSEGGLDRFAWGNLGSTHTKRYSGHLVMAILVVIWFCYVIYQELIHYIEVRQAWMTSPKHRIRASATTVLVENIPDKWCSIKALDELFDVFPGGIRNIWVNRDFGDLLDKKRQQLELTRKLENAETNLIRACQAKACATRRKALQARNPEQMSNKERKEEVRENEESLNEASTSLMNSPGLSTGKPLDTINLIDQLKAQRGKGHNPTKSQSKAALPMKIIGGGIGAVNVGIKGIGWGVSTVGKFGQSTVEGVANRFRTPRPGVPEQKVPPEIPKERPDPDHLHHERDHSDDVQVDGAATAMGSDLEHATLNLAASTDHVHHGPDTSYGHRTGAQPELSEEAEAPAGADHSPEPKLHHLNPRRLFRKTSSFPSPEPAHLQDDEYPITRASPQPDFSPSSTTSSNLRHTNRAEAAHTTDTRISENYAKMPKIIDWEVYDAKLIEECEKAKWAEHIRRKDRETMRISLFPKSIIWWKIWPSWWPSLGKKVDVILYCRLQLLELNKEIARDEAQLEKFPLMNSAFIQFNHQAAAHMACQSITHHKPKNMGPRIIEMDPKDVIWDNLSITWWNKYIRTTSVIAIIIGIIITWAIPMAFVGLLSQLDTIANRLTWLHWVANLPRWLKSVIQGVLPPTLQALLLIVLPDIFRLLVEFTGVPTRVQVELDLQAYWFIFLFVQVFLVVTLSSGLTNVIQQIANSPLSVPQILAQNLPKGSNYFYSYMILQALTSSSLTLSQIAALFQWYVLGKAIDSTAREKFNRVTKLPSLGWGTAFALHTNFTCIVLIYSIVAPLMLFFGCLVSILYLIVQRYNCLFVNRWKTDSGGLFFPRAVNQTFTGIYVLVLVLIGLFFLVRDKKGNVVCIPHAIVMIVVGLLVIIYHYMLNKSLGSLFTYVPITMEDEAQRNQIEFEKKLAEKYKKNINTTTTSEAQRLLSEDPEADQTRKELDQLEIELSEYNRGQETRLDGEPEPKEYKKPHENVMSRIGRLLGVSPRTDSKTIEDPEAKRPKQSGFLFEGFEDELEDLAPFERDVLVQRAFHHEALRMKKPAVWIPQDIANVSNDEVRRSEALCNELGTPSEQALWITNQYSAVDAKAKVRFARPPPDFDEAEEFMQL